MGPRLFRALLDRVGRAPPESDAELLRQFAATGDEPAFAELVRRYGGLVWGQCRHLLPSEADAEDAFQATFLILARRPGAVRTAVGPYLHGVAYRVCLNTRRLAGRRKKREVASATSEAERPVADSAWDAALAIVHDELHRLPGPQREAFVLCVLEGRGLTDAAMHLGVKLGTLSARLSRAKQAVMDRLAARGVVAGVAAVSALAPAGVSAAATAKAIQAAVGSSVIPESVLVLTQGVARMVTSKLKLLAAGVVLACGLGLSVGTGWVATAQDGPKPKDKPVAAVPPAKEFKYVPLKDDAGTVEDFEKLVRANEADGYTFAGSVPLKGFKNEVGRTTVTALVFRKKPAGKVAADDLRGVREELLLRYDEQKQTELLLKKRYEELTAEQAAILDRAKAAQARETQLRAEINALEERLKKNPVAAVRKQMATTVELGPKAADLAKALQAFAEKKFDGRADALRLSIYGHGTALRVEGDDDAVRWAVDLVESLK